jgi:hypothetical protein
MQVTKQLKKHTKALLLKVNTEKDIRSIMTATLMCLLEHGQQGLTMFSEQWKIFPAFV